jgi:hypothetical protein
VESTIATLLLKSLPQIALGRHATSSKFGCGRMGNSSTHLWAAGCDQPVAVILKRYAMMSRTSNRVEYHKTAKRLQLQAALIVTILQKGIS